MYFELVKVWECHEFFWLSYIHFSSIFRNFPSFFDRLWQCPGFALHGNPILSSDLNLLSEIGWGSKPWKRIADNNRKKHVKDYYFFLVFFPISYISRQGFESETNSDKTFEFLGKFYSGYSILKIIKMRFCAESSYVSQITQNRVFDVIFCILRFLDYKKVNKK